MTAATVEIDGMTCAACTSRAERILRAVPGVTGATVQLADRRATVEFAGDPDIPALARALSGAGFALAEAETVLDVEGMTCAACHGRVERVLTAQPGVLAATVNPATRQARVRHAAGPGVVATLLGALAAAGYPAAPAGAQADRTAAEVAAAGRRALAAAVLTAPVVMLEMGGHLVPAFHHWVMHTLGLWSWWAQAVLATAVLAGPGRGFWARGLAAARHSAADMNTLVALGTGAAWAWSMAVLLAPAAIPEAGRAVYFEAAAVIVTLVLAGRWMEARARGRAGAAIRRLAALAPREAEVELPGGGTAPRAAAALVPGDVVRLRPGASVPADGVVIEGTSHIDESMLTGEPMPVAKAAGAPVTGGTVNGPGFLRMRVTRTGADTVLAQIIRAVETAQAARLPVQALVDRVTAVFVPVVLAVAAVTVMAWLATGGTAAQALTAGVAVLIIACPCAMGLATPVSLTVAAGRAAERGVLFRRGEALQTLAGARTVAFDKTGTLTEGRPALSAFTGDDALLAAAAGLAGMSEHPVASAIAAGAAARGVTPAAVEGFESLTGRGMRGTVAGAAVVVGSARAMSEAVVDVAPLAAEAAARAAEGQTVLYAAAGGRAALIAVADPLRAGAAPAVAALRRMGLTVAMISGDGRATAEAVARAAGIDIVTAGVLPEGKVAALAALPGPVAFVGDGINDAPALAAAGTGIAMGTGTDVAIEAADVVITRGDPMAVADAVAIARATLRNIRENLVWAFGYNVLLIPVAAGALVPFGGPMLSPMLAAGAMALSSVMVLGNALRLRRAGVRP